MSLPEILSMRRKGRVLRAFAESTELPRGGFASAHRVRCNPVRSRNRPGRGPCRQACNGGQAIGGRTRSLTQTHAAPFVHAPHRPPQTSVNRDLEVFRGRDGIGPGRFGGLRRRRATAAIAAAWPSPVRIAAGRGRPCPCETAGQRRSRQYRRKRAPKQR